MSSRPTLHPHTFEERLAEIRDELVALENWNERHRFLSELGRKLPPFPEDSRTVEAQVPGCLSRLWIACTAAHGTLGLRIEAEAIFMKGLAALLVNLCDGLPLEDAGRLTPAFLDELGIPGNVTPVRAQALRNLVERIAVEARKLQGAATGAHPLVAEPDLYTHRFAGLHRLYSQSPAERLKRAHVAVVGIGGVGTWVVEALARSGVGTLTLIDQDEVCITNTNRQLHAIQENLGVSKVRAMAARVRAINPECVVHEIPRFFSEENADELLSTPYDFVVDAIDSMAAKCLLVAECQRRALPVVISGGAGGKHDPTAVRMGDLGHSSGDALLKALKKKLRRFHGIGPEQGPWGISCVFSIEPPHEVWKSCQVSAEPGARLNCSGGLGSATFVTGTFGFFMASHVINSLALPR